MPMSHDRIVPWGVGAVSTVGAAMVDINYGAIAGGITLVGGAGAAVYWQIAQNRTKAYRDAEAAKVQAFKDSEAAKLDAERAAAELRIRLQREQAEANRASLSDQMAALQSSVDQANRTLEDQRKLNDTLQELVVGLKGRLEDANKKLHDLNNEANAKSLQYEADKMVAQARHDSEKRELQDRADQLMAQLEALTRAHEESAARLGPRIAENAERIDRIEGGRP